MCMLTAMQHNTDLRCDKIMQSTYSYLATQHQAIIYTSQICSRKSCLGSTTVIWRLLCRAGKTPPCS